MDQHAPTGLDVKLSLGPVPYFWSRGALLDFYRAVADWPVDIVHLGEVVCPKRRSLRFEDWVAIGERLQAAGKEVRLSTLTLIEAGSEAGALRRLCEQSPFGIEANDFGAVQVVSRLGRPFTTGPAVNVYNEHTLDYLRILGLHRFVLPVELGLEALEGLTSAVPDVEAEVLAWGRLPLAWSARCYTARAENLPKDQCNLACGDDPDGRLLETREGQPFLVLNGIQTQSALTQNLAPWMAELSDAGARVLRISPQSQATGSVVRTFERLRSEGVSRAVLSNLERLAPVGCCDGYWQGAAGFERFGMPDAV